MSKQTLIIRNRISNVDYTEKENETVNHGCRKLVQKEDKARNNLA